MVQLVRVVDRVAAVGDLQDHEVLQGQDQMICGLLDRRYQLQERPCEEEASLLAFLVGAEGYPVVAALVERDRLCASSKHSDARPKLAPHQKETSMLA